MLAQSDILFELKCVGGSYTNQFGLEHHLTPQELKEGMDFPNDTPAFVRDSGTPTSTFSFNWSLSYYKPTVNVSLSSHPDNVFLKKIKKIFVSQNLKYSDEKKFQAVIAAYRELEFGLVNMKIAEDNRTSSFETYDPSMEVCDSWGEVVASNPAADIKVPPVSPDKNDKRKRILEPKTHHQRIRQALGIPNPNKTAKSLWEMSTVTSGPGDGTATGPRHHHRPETIGESLSAGPQSSTGLSAPPGFSGPQGPQGAAALSSDLH